MEPCKRDGWCEGGTREFGDSKTRRCGQVGKPRVEGWAGREAVLADRGGRGGQGSSATEEPGQPTAAHRCGVRPRRAAQPKAAGPPPRAGGPTPVLQAGPRQWLRLEQRGRGEKTEFWEDGREGGRGLRFGETERGVVRGGSGARSPLGVLAPSHRAKDLTSCASVYLSVKEGWEEKTVAVSKGS